MSLFSNLNFVLKFIAMICDIVIVVLWMVSDSRPIPLIRFIGEVFFYHAVGGYLVILIVFVILYLLDEPPGQWAHRFYCVVGAILFLICGIIGIVRFLNEEATSTGILVAILMICIGVMLVVDVIKSEGII